MSNYLMSTWARHELLRKKGVEAARERGRERGGGRGGQSLATAHLCLISNIVYFLFVDLHAVL